MVSRRCPAIIIILMLAVAMLGAPLSDVMTFGLHDHVAGADGDSDAAQLGRAASDGVHTAHHHCELSMNPANMHQFENSGVSLLIRALETGSQAVLTALPLSAPFPPPRS